MNCNSSLFLLRGNLLNCDCKWIDPHSHLPHTHSRYTGRACVCTWVCGVYQLECLYFEHENWSDDGYIGYIAAGIHVKCICFRLVVVYWNNRDCLLCVRCALCECLFVCLLSTCLYYRKCVVADHIAVAIHSIVKNRRWLWWQRPKPSFRKIVCGHAQCTYFYTPTCCCCHRRRLRHTKLFHTHTHSEHLKIKRTKADEEEAKETTINNLLMTWNHFVYFIIIYFPLLLHLHWMTDGSRITN